MEKCYIVRWESGSYDSHVEINHAVFTDFEQAKASADKINAFYEELLTKFYTAEMEQAISEQKVPRWSTGYDRWVAIFGEEYRYYDHSEFCCAYVQEISFNNDPEIAKKYSRSEVDVTERFYMSQKVCDAIGYTKVCDELNRKMYPEHYNDSE